MRRPLKGIRERRIIFERIIYKTVTCNSDFFKRKRTIRKGDNTLMPSPSLKAQQT